MVNRIPLRLVITRLILLCSVVSLSAAVTVTAPFLGRPTPFADYVRPEQLPPGKAREMDPIRQRADR
jgi:hypothetical protein